MRAGTLQYLHVSEFGKICAQYPEKAREIVTGALNTVEAGQFIVIESTAEGQEGAFYRMCQEARTHAAMGKPLTLLDWKFHFFPWWKDDAYRLDDAAVVIGEEYERYFERLEAEGHHAHPGQKAWYVKKDKTLGGDMRREYPSTPDEAFEQALEGAYFAHQLAAAAKQGRIGSFPSMSARPVNTFWDLGRNDQNCIWLHQGVNGFHRFVGYYENSGEFIGHYVSWLKEWARERDVGFGDHYIPHDGDRESLWLENGTKGVMDGLGFSPDIVERPRRARARQSPPRAAIFATCQFDEKACDLGSEAPSRTTARNGTTSMASGRTAPATTTPRMAPMPSSPSPAADTNLRRREAVLTARSTTAARLGRCRPRYDRMRRPTGGQTDGERTSDRSCRADGSRLGCRGNHLSKARLHLDAQSGAR